MKARPSPVSTLVLQAMKPGTGYTAAGLAPELGLPRIVAYRSLNRLARKRMIGERTIGGGQVYFVSQADAETFDAQAASALAQVLRNKRAENLEHNKRRASASSQNRVVKEKPGRPAPVVIAPPPKIDRPVDMSSAVWTIAKTPLARFAVDPASIEPGAFVVDLPAGRWSDYAVRGAA